MKIHELPVTDLIHPDYNPREINESEFDQLKTSIKKFGFLDPLICNQEPSRKNIVVGGNMRLEAAKALGFTSVPVVFVTLTLQEERELNIRLNKNTGRWDFDTLTSFFTNTELLEWGWQPYELEVINGEKDAPSYLDEQRETKESIKFVIKFEDIAELEKFKLEHGFTKSQVTYEEFEKHSPS